MTQEVALMGNPNDWSPAILSVPLRARDGSVRARALLDATDRGLAARRWCFTGNGYVHRALTHDERAGDGITHVLMHREVLGLPRMGREIQADHINKDKLDNRRCNLEAVTQQENIRRQGMSGMAAIHASKTCCPTCGGSFSVVVNRRAASGTARICKPCNAEYKKRWARERRLTK